MNVFEGEDRFSVFIWLGRIAPTQPTTEMLAFLDPREIDHAATFKTEKLRKQFLAGRSWMRRILSLHLDCPADSIKLNTGELGKPFLQFPPSNLTFNFSRQAFSFACAIAIDRPVGIDLEKIRSLCDMSETAATTLSDTDFEHWRQFDESKRTELFFRNWSRKEAVLKATGTGISQGVKNISTGISIYEPRTGELVEVATKRYFLSDFTVAPDFSSSIAVQISRSETIIGYCDDIFDSGDSISIGDTSIQVPADSKLILRHFR